MIQRDELKHRKAIDVAENFIRIAKAEGKTLTLDELQNLMFFAQGVWLYYFNKPLFDDDIYYNTNTSDYGYFKKILEWKENERIKK